MLCYNVSYIIDRSKVFNVITCQVLRLMVYINISKDLITSRSLSGIQLFEDPDSPAISSDYQCIKTDNSPLYFRYSQ